MTKYFIPDRLHENPVIHCATLSITPTVLDGGRWPQLAQPDAALRNGTLTFVRSKDRTFGITCDHVVKKCRELNASNEDFYTMRTMLNGFITVGDRFIQPKAVMGGKQPDIAIRELHPDFVTRLGKTPIDLDIDVSPPEDLSFGYAVGFPEKLKSKRFEDGSEYAFRVAMPHVSIIAELPRKPESHFGMRSAVNELPPDVDYSGMSGGPIYWCSGEAYGIMGIVYEGGASYGETMIEVFGELATPNVIKDWISQCPPLYPKAARS